MKISFNPSNSNKNILDLIKNNKDIIFDLKGHNIFARGVKFQGTDTWRDIKIVGKSIGSNTLDLYPGENIRFINNTFGKITIESTWRPVVNNLNSNSTTKSLSAKQGNVLAELINTLTNNVSNNYALRDGSNATGRWQGGLACLDIRDINKNPGDLNQGLELHLVGNTTNGLKDGGTYNGVFSFKQWSDFTGGEAHQLAFTDNGNMWHRTSAQDSWGTWKKLAYATDIPLSLKNPYALTISLNGISQGPYDGSAVKNINITPGSIGASASGHNHDHKYLKWLGNAEQTNMNDIGRISHSSGMTELSDPGNTIDNPMEGNIKSTSWHLYWQTNYTDDPGGSNSWVAQIVNKAGTDRWWVRSRRGGTITNGTNWSSNWRFLVTAPTSGLGSGNQPIYINNAGEVVTANSYPTSLPANGGNADTVDGEHASGFVRAGNYESQDLNNLDTYSFIKSVAANNISTSPNGRLGWYNIIQAVHRNGAADGSNFIGQIALGMSASNNGMFYRIKDNGSWDNWKEVVTTNTGLLRYSRNNINISSSNCSPIPPSLLEWTIGYPRLYDPEFNEGYNNVQVYNNANNGVVTITRVSDTNVGNSGNYVLKVVSAVGAVPYCGGWHIATQTELGKVYTCLFRANVPSGVLIDFNTNSIGTGGQWSWLTNSIGTGKWTWYAAQVYCGSGGSTTFFFAAMSPCTWYLSYVNVIENNRASYAGLRSVYSDYLKANASIVFGRNELQYFNQYTSTTSGATNNANPTTDWYHILRMNHANSSGFFVDLAIPFNSNRIQFRRIVTGADAGWHRIITEEPNNHNVLLCDSNAGGNVGIGTSSPTQKLDVLGNIRASGQIVREASSVYWYKGREGALLRETSSSGYHTLWSLKTANGSWDFGEYNHDNDWNNVPLLSYITDTDFNNGNNAATYQIKFPLASGTVALTSDILNPTSCYWANVKISDYPSINTSPTVNTLTATRVCAGHDPGIDNSISCSGWFRSSGDTGWYNTTYRGGWYMSDTDWIRAHNDVGIYTGGQIYSSNSIRMGDIYLQNGNEINNTNSNLYINYRGTSSINMCHGGGSVIIGPQINNVNNNKLYVNGAATIAGSTTLNSTATFNGLVYNNGGILPATCDFNNTGAGYSVWGDAMSTGVTAITDALDPIYVDIQYSQDSGTTWIDYALSDQDKFNLYANNGSSISIFLGNNGASSLAQVQKNQSMVTFEIPDGLYSALCWASVDIGNGIQTVCTVEIISKNGTIIQTFTKTMIGWNKFNYINFWGIDNSITDIGSDQVRFVRFKFKHNTGNTNIRNAQIRKIRLFSFTKFYLDPSDFRSIMGNTGHLYKYDKNLNVTFPNIINCKTLDITNAIRVGNNLSIYSKSGTKKLAQLDQSDILSIYTKIYLSKGLCVGLQGPTFAGNVTTDDASAFIGTVPSGSFIFTFKPALNGQLLFLKLLKSSNTTKFMCATENCKVVRSSDFSISININNAAEVFGDGRSRIFIYQSAYSRWLEFYCG